MSQRNVSPTLLSDAEYFHPSDDDIPRNTHLRLWMFPYSPNTPRAERDKWIFAGRVGRGVAIGLILLVVAWYLRMIILGS
jgi:hypothetical protein